MQRSRIVLDAMGGDHGLAVPVEAAVRAASERDIQVTLVGDERLVASELRSQDYFSHSPDVIDAPESVSMEDEAVAAVRRKRRASIPVGLELVKSGRCDGFVSAGNTGAVVASSVVSLGRLPGVSRPGIAIQIPTIDGPPMLLIDAGAITDPKPEFLWQHARLANVYAKSALGVEDPRIGLISNGEEPGKGNLLTRQAHDLLSSDPGIRFIGNIEARAIPRGVCDVAVTDGFTGNVILKTSEGIVNLMQESLRTEFKRRVHTGVLAALLRPAFRRAGRALDYREYGGAPLLGVDGLVMIAHGSSDVTALTNALIAADEAVRKGSVPAMREALSARGESNVAGA